MEHREWFAPEEDKDYIKSLLSTHTGIIWKAIETVSGQTAGLFIVVFPGKHSENLDYDIGLPENRVVQCSTHGYGSSASQLPRLRITTFTYKSGQKKP